MILQALARHYETLAARGEIDRPGWSKSGISFALYLTEDGELERVGSMKTEQPRGKKTVLGPQEMSLPAAPSGRTSTAVKPAFLWDNQKYILGISKDGLSPKYFDGSKALHHQLLDHVDSPAAKALLNFFDRWDPAKAAEHPALQENWEELISGANLVFRYDGAFLQKDPLIQKAWQDYYDSDGEGPEMVCLVTGRKGPVEAVHPVIKGVAGGQPSGTALVSYNADAFCSYGREKSLNAPVSKGAAFAYTAALNYLLADREHLKRIGDTTVLFWAESGEPAFQDVFSGFTFGEDARYDAGDLGGMLNDLLHGRAVQYDEVLLDPKMDFYILGLSPNAARLSVRFFLKNTFGGFLKNVQKHYERLYLPRSPRDKFEDIFISTLLDDIVNKKSKEKLYDEMFGETLKAILTDTRYPSTLRNYTYLRIRSERDINRTKASILKANLLKKQEPGPTHPQIMEALQMELNETCTYQPYVLGRLFSVMEKIQLASADWEIKRTIKDSYFTSAATTPKIIFSKLFPLSEYHMRKLKRDKFNYARILEKEKNEIVSLLTAPIPVHFTPDEIDCFYIGYYHQNIKKENKEEK